MTDAARGLEEGVVRAHRLHHADGLHQAGLLDREMGGMCHCRACSMQIPDLRGGEVLRAGDGCHCQVFGLLRVRDLEENAIGTGGSNAAPCRDHPPTWTTGGRNSTAGRAWLVA